MVSRASDTSTARSTWRSSRQSFHTSGNLRWKRFLRESGDCKDYAVAKAAMPGHSTLGSAVISGLCSASGPIRPPSCQTATAAS